MKLTKTNFKRPTAWKPEGYEVFRKFTSLKDYADFSHGIHAGGDDSYVVVTEHELKSAMYTRAAGILVSRELEGNADKIAELGIGCNHITSYLWNYPWMMYSEKADALYCRVWGLDSDNSAKIVCELYDILDVRTMILDANNLVEKFVKEAREDKYYMPKAPERSYGFVMDKMRVHINELFDDCWFANESDNIYEMGI